MTNFFEQQKLAKAKSRKIIFTFIIFLGLQFGAIYYLYAKYASIRESVYAEGSFEPNEAGVDHDALKIALGAALIFLVLFMYRRFSFFSKPSQIPQRMGAKRIDFESKDPDEQTYYNIVSEMTLASGIPMPEVYVLKKELAVNAFTSGHNHQNANIVVTQGALDKFTRDELQAVVGHEFGHIVSGDVRSNIELLSVAFSFSAIFTVGYYLLRIFGRGSSRRSSKGGGGQLVLIAFAVMAFGAIGSFIARVISSMFSRQREYLADALSVQFTRYPASLASALAKIRDGAGGSVLDAANGSEVSAICFSSSLSWMSLVFSTHPPLDERIKKIDPQFLEEGSSFKKEKEKETEKPSYQNLGIAVGGEKSLQYLATLGLLTEEDMSAAEVTLNEIKKNDLSPYLNTYSVEALVYSVLISEENEAEQKSIILEHASKELVEKVSEIRSIFKETEAVQKVSLMELIVPLFSQISASVSMRILEVSKLLVDQDGEVTPFESFMYLFVKKYNYGLEGDYKTPSPADIVYLIISVASMNVENPDLIEQAKKEALREYFGKEITEVSSTGDMENVFCRISKLSLKNKEKLVKALMKAVTFDKYLNREEFESFRIICDAMEVPAPPINI
ncbi:MAG: M48 family metallopeptidase [Bdellovibrionales bacterium]